MKPGLVRFQSRQDSILLKSVKMDGFRNVNYYSLPYNKAVNLTTAELGVSPLPPNVIFVGDAFGPSQPNGG